MVEHGNSFFLVTLMVLATVLLIFAMKYVFKAQGARTERDRENLYRDLATRAAAAEGACASAVDGIQSELKDIRVRLGAIEKLLRDVG